MFDFERGVLTREIVVDTGALTKGFKFFDISLAYCKNHLFFFKRFDHEHRLQALNLLTLEQSEVSGYAIHEPSHENIQYQVMFSQEIGKADSWSNDVKTFLKGQNVFCQSFQVG